MTNENAKKFLLQNLEELFKMKKWLEHSLDLCLKIKNFDDFDIFDLDKLEALTSRYARLCDFIINKMFRSIDSYEFVDTGTIIDRLNRSLKRNIGESLDQWREFKDLRNEIAHDYILFNNSHIYEKTLKYSQLLLDIVDEIHSYCKKIIE